MKKQIDIGSMYGIREEYLAKGLIKEIPEVDYKNYIAHGQNLMFLTVVWGNPTWEKIFKDALAMCEKYNIRVIIHDNVMNAKGLDLTEEDVKNYTSYYKDSPVWIGNGFDDEPSPADYPRIQHTLETYLKVYPEKDTTFCTTPKGIAMFSHNYFNKFVKSFEETLMTFSEAIENKDYVTARSLLDKQFEIIHTMRELGRKAYEELDISSYGYANNYADLFEKRLHLDVLVLIDAISGKVSK